MTGYPFSKKSFALTHVLELKPTYLGLKHCSNLLFPCPKLIYFHAKPPKYSLLCCSGMPVAVRDMKPQPQGGGYDHPSHTITVSMQLECVDLHIIWSNTAICTLQHRRGGPGVLARYPIPNDPPQKKRKKEKATPYHCISPIECFSRSWRCIWILVTELNRQTFNIMRTRRVNTPPPPPQKKGFSKKSTSF